MPQPYAQRLSRRYPGLFVILIDQSGSMQEPVPSQGNVTKADFAASALNTLIYAMVKEGKYDATTGLPRKYAYISLLGYGSSVDGLLTGDGTPVDIPYLSGHPLRYEMIDRNELNSVTGQYEVVSENVPIWIEPRAQGQTEMAQALLRARDIVHAWLAQPPEVGQGSRQDCFPPIILNITDGQHQGAGDPLFAAQALRFEQTSYGNALLYNCHFTQDMQNATVFPSNIEQVQQLNPFAAQMFEMSSLIPDQLRRKAEEINAGRPVAEGARGMVYNSDATMLVRFLTWGTVGSVGIEGSRG